LKNSVLLEDHLLYLNGNESENGYVAVGCKEEVVFHSQNIDLEVLNSFLSIPNEWKFGYISYDVKNNFETLTSSNTDELEFSEIQFFIPKTLFKVTGEDITLIYGDASILPEIKTLLMKKGGEAQGSVQLSWLH